METREFPTAVVASLSSGVAASKEEAALSLLFGQAGATVEDVKFSLGEGARSASEEVVWQQVHLALMQERMGDATVSTSFTDPARLRDAEAILNSL